MILRSLIERIILTPREDGRSLSVDLIGDLAGTLSIATKRDKLAVQRDLSNVQPVNRTDESGAKTCTDRQSKKASGAAGFAVSEAFRVVVAGAGFEPAAFRL